VSVGLLLPLELMIILMGPSFSVQIIINCTRTSVKFTNPIGFFLKFIRKIIIIIIRGRSGWKCETQSDVSICQHWHVCVSAYLFMENAVVGAAKMGLPALWFRAARRC
jgi:hypothetical protein